METRTSSVRNQVTHTTTCPCQECERERAAHDRARREVQAGRRTRRDITEHLGRNSDEREVSWFSLNDTAREGSHVALTDLKPSFVRYLDGFTSRRAVAVMQQLHPELMPAFLLAYPLLDDEATPMGQKQIAERLFVSQPTVSRMLKKARAIFAALYQGYDDRDLSAHPLSHVAEAWGDDTMEDY